MINYACMPERILQYRFNAPPLDVTPKDFKGLDPEGKRLPRFVREASTPYSPIRSPADAAEYLMKHIFNPFEAFDQEEMWALLLDAKARVTHEVMVYRGTVSAISFRESEILKEAVRLNSLMIILSHCHPSGDPEPSPEDIRTTRKIKQAADLLDIQLADHIVIGDNSWVSLKERGLGFESQG